MEWIAEIKEPRKLKGVIKDKGTEENPGLYYLYIYENNRCIWDTLQDSLSVAIDIASRDYGIPVSNWEKVK